MVTDVYLGELEQQVLLVILGLRDCAHGADIARELETHAGRRISRGALYATLDRLETKGLLRHTRVPGDATRDGLPRRAYVVTATGLATLRASRDVLQRLWRRLDRALEDKTR